MSGGSSKKKKDDDKAVSADAVPSYLGGGVQSTFPQAMPGQLNALAEQLSMGYGAPVSQNLSFLEALYNPMNVPMKPVAAKPAASKPASKASPSVNVPGGSSHLSGWQERRKDGGRR